jgi:hypothetical protein
LIRNFANAGLDFLDLQRSKVLRVVLRTRSLQEIYRDRSRRLALLHLIWCFFALPIAVAAPIISLILAPLIYGVPHLWASARFVAHSTFPFVEIGIRKMIVVALAGALLGLGLMESRRLISLGLSDGIVYSILFSLSLVVLSLNKTIPLKFKGDGVLRIAWLTFSLVSLCVFFLRAPISTAAVLMFVHNFVGYLYWLRAASTRREKGAALACLGFATLLSTAVLSGLTDRWLLLSQLNQYMPADIEQAVQSLVSLLGMTEFLAPGRLIAVFAFTQSLHYFIWLKALGDQHLPSQNPTSIRRSVRLLAADFGGLLGIACTASILFIWIYAFYSYSPARALYLTVSGAHGYLELCALFFVRGFGRQA